MTSFSMENWQGMGKPFLYPPSTASHAIAIFSTNQPASYRSESSKLAQQYQLRQQACLFDMSNSVWNKEQRVITKAYILSLDLTMKMFLKASFSRLKNHDVQDFDRDPEEYWLSVILMPSEKGIPVELLRRKVQGKQLFLQHPPSGMKMI
jgi:hypothetical protein